MKQLELIQTIQQIFGDGSFEAMGMLLPESNANREVVEKVIELRKRALELVEQALVEPQGGIIVINVKKGEGSKSRDPRIMETPSNNGRGNQPDTHKPGASKPDTHKPGASKPDTHKPNPGKPNPGKPSANKPNGKPGADK